MRERFYPSLTDWGQLRQETKIKFVIPRFYLCQPNPVQWFVFVNKTSSPQEQTKNTKNNKFNRLLPHL